MSQARSGRGFAGMDADKQREIASKGGRAAHEKGTAHEFDSDEARVAGRKGGLSVSQNREHMAAIGRHGGQARGARAQAARAAAVADRARESTIDRTDRVEPMDRDERVAEPAAHSPSASSTNASLPRNEEQPAAGE